MSLFPAVITMGVPERNWSIIIEKALARPLSIWRDTNGTVPVLLP
jgi:hypothetical protein